MSTAPALRPELASALESLQSALAACDPDRPREVGGAAKALREVNALFDPRKARAASTLCLAAMRLLEELGAHERVRPPAALDVARELCAQLRPLLEASALPHQPAAAVPSAPRPAGGITLKLIDDLKLGDMLVRTNALTDEDVQRVLQAQLAQKASERRKFGELCVELGLCSQDAIDSALRLQQRSRGQPVEPAPAGDPWGSAPL